jgi:hypothetical protein
VPRKSWPKLVSVRSNEHRIFFCWIFWIFVSY